MLKDVKFCVTLPILLPVRSVDRTALTTLNAQIGSAWYLQVFFLRPCFFAFAPKTLRKMKLHTGMEKLMARPTKIKICVHA